jgi:DNA-binding CsgD family transcriptional regulator
MAVERLLAGMPVNSTRAERQAAVAALTARQKTAAEIAERLRVSQRTVVRLRARERVSA